MTFEESSEGGESAGRVSSKCKGPEARMFLASPRNSSVAKQSELDKMIEEEVRKVITARSVELDRLSFVSYMH